MVFSVFVGCQVRRNFVGCFQVTTVERTQFAHAVKREITCGVGQESCLGVVLDHDFSSIPQVGKGFQDGRAGRKAKVIDEIDCLTVAKLLFKVSDVNYEAWRDAVIIAAKSAGSKRVDNGWAKIRR